MLAFWAYMRKQYADLWIMRTLCMWIELIKSHFNRQTECERAWNVAAKWWFLTREPKKKNQRLRPWGFDSLTLIIKCQKHSMWKWMHLFTDKNKLPHIKQFLFSFSFFLLFYFREQFVPLGWLFFSVSQ